MKILIDTYCDKTPKIDIVGKGSALPGREPSPTVNHTEKVEAKKNSFVDNTGNTVYRDNIKDLREVFYNAKKKNPEKYRGMKAIPHKGSDGYYIYLSKKYKKGS